MDQKTWIGAAAAFVTVALLATFWVSWRTGLPAGLLAAVFMLTPGLLEGILPEEHMAKVRFGLRPLGIMVLLVLVLAFPYLITPAFLAPAIPVAEAETNLARYGYQRMEIEGKLGRSEPLGFAIGSDFILKLELSEGRNGVTAYYKLPQDGQLPAEGTRIRLSGVIEPYGGGSWHFVGRKLRVAQ